MTKVSPAALRFGSALCLLLGWQVAAWWSQSSLLPGPLPVLQLILRETIDGQLIHHLGATLRRVILAFLIAMLIGSLVGILMGRWRTIDLVLDPWLILFLNIPALVIIILAYVWFGLAEATAIFAIALNKIPNVVVILREGARTLDRDYLEMARSYDLGRAKTLIYVVLPQLLPYFAVAARSGLSLIWKIVLVVELLGRNDGVGFVLHVYFQLFDVTGILAYSLSFILVMLVIEYALLQPLERNANRWRR
ncbi:ABC transporter permease [Thiocapsa rosea]|uniref:NitT/TauT family transport system permease protein n=1 Tax=Thiocapsa rosea TaxID=69360 RepID=A0A495VCQ2_9GAMM|nr:ABC transporter permease [Thiocapsa rosea]RKT47132.1 NitT/TauT family transport system permease protein [Thiocapsa rosea]